MTLEEKIKYILRKYPDTRYDRAEFMWKYMETYHGVKMYALKSQFKEFWKEEAGLERMLRDVLKEDEFKLPPEQDSKRYERQAEFKRFKSKLKPKDKQQFENVFEGDNDEQMEKLARNGTFG